MKRRARGFTLLEVIIAFALLGLALTLLLGSLSGGAKQVRDAEHRLAAEKTGLGRAIKEAKRPPCTKKYSGGTSLNVFALIPLAIDTITDTGCKW